MREMHSKRPKFSKFSGGAYPRTPLAAHALWRSLKMPSASFSISPPTSQILPSTPFLIENPECINFVSVTPSSLVPIKSVKFSRFISCCKRSMIVLVSNAGIANNKLK